jgi:hypothetical protein
MAFLIDAGMQLMPWIESCSEPLRELVRTRRKSIHGGSAAAVLAADGPDQLPQRL